MATRPRRDFPYYRGEPVALSGLGWVLALGGCVAGFLCLILVPRGEAGQALGLAGPLLFVSLPLVGLALAAGRGWTALFPRPTTRDLLLGLAFMPLTLLVSGVVAFFYSKAGLAHASPVADMLVQLPGAKRAIFLAGTAPQLLGEELVTILPLLGVLTLCHRRLGLPRGASIAIAWLVSAMIFGALHLSTYGWNLVQVLLVIGVARLVLTIPYLLTRSVWASFTAHICLDWSIFAFVLLQGARA
ncbi:CPBP family intramembrane glutamic endopeptidase [Caulobacter endophyticus]|uniref:CPBP family intramembrane glutamic endopeptidase n=1 Tax=Caulobacter endophyticus TaxID=2172652 RepID=UPI00240F7EE5|nr:CPBP family intramembrane glutamic endopeptidase [Caulobacter endophyticus]MDG2530841.1 CPBP family intramembrane metalloprotease [Caulobacter endophyticus]